MTSLAEEREEQRRWRPRPGAPLAALHAQLVDNEFLEPDAMSVYISGRLGRVLDHAQREVPWYAQRVPAPAARPLDDLRRFPVLRRDDLVASYDDLRARRLPPGEMACRTTASSGTTGSQAKVLHTRNSDLMFSILAQRHYRWFRFDPTAKFASIRRAAANPVLADGTLLPDGRFCRVDRWRYGGATFQTGPFVFTNASNSLESQIRWLEQEQPRYLQTYPSALGQLACACDGNWPVAGLEKLHAISEQLTAPTRAKLERTLQAPVEIAHGLNEIGLVAGRCAAGRYHVHIEHCLVEILDDDGEPCPPGASGHVVVTALRNPAMPLIRYDTGDIAVAVEGPCSCGRLLPSFGEIVGRSRLAALPPGSTALIGVIDEAINSMPVALAAGFRQFQIHQHLDRSFELRIGSVTPPSAGFLEWLMAAWRPAAGDIPLRITRVARIERHKAGKWPFFASDFLSPATPDDRWPSMVATESARRGR